MALEMLESSSSEESDDEASDDEASGSLPIGEEDPRKSFRIWRAMLWLVALFVYTSVSEVFIKLLSCREFGEIWLSYYAPQYHCFDDYHGWQYFLCFVVLLILAFPAVIVANTWRHEREVQADKLKVAAKSIQIDEDEAPKQRLSLRRYLAQPFTTPCWWWEGVLMFRRLMLVIFSVLPIDLVQRQALITIGCISIFGLHVYFLPFSNPGVNMCESTMLFILTIIAVLEMLKNQAPCTIHHACCFTMRVPCFGPF